MNKNVDIVKDFVAAWSRLDVDELLSYFAEDGTYYNMPFAPVTGHEGLRDFISAFLKDWTETNWDLLHIFGDGDVVVAERLDRTKVGDIAVDLPCCGIFEMQDGKIKMWRDYFDMATYTRPFEGKT